MNAATIPAELRERDQWVVWKYERRKGKRTKVPYRAADARTRAESDDPRSWGTFEQAIARVAEVQGIGYVFSPDDPYAGIDIDGCIDPETGEVHPDAAAVLADLDSYSEPSPSGTGMHAIVAACLPNGKGRETRQTPWCQGDRHELAIYDRGRFFTITGDGAGVIAERQSQVDRLLEQFFAKRSNGAGQSEQSAGEDRSVEELLKKFRRFKKLVGRTEGDDDSAKDYAIAAEGRRVGLSRGEVAKLIHQARPGDPKLQRDDYIDRTIDAAWAEVDERKPGHTDDDPAKFINDRLNVKDDPFISGRVVGAGDGGVVRLRRAGDTEVRIGHLSDWFHARTLDKLASTRIGTKFEKLTEVDAHQLAQAAIALCKPSAVDEREMAEQWITDFIDRVGRVIQQADDHGNERPLATVLSDRYWAEHDEDLRRAGDIAGRTAIVLGLDGRVWIPSNPLRQSLSPGAPTWSEFWGEMADIGWVREKREVSAESLTKRHIKVIFAVGPAY